MADIFLSYTKSDQAIAQALAEALTSEGWTVFWDYKIQIGDEWDRVLEEELKKARCVVVLWSKTSIKHRWVRLEAKEGLRRSVLVPILIEEAVEPPLEFQYVQAADLLFATKHATEVASLEAYPSILSAIEVFAPLIDIAGYWWMRVIGTNLTEYQQIAVLLVSLHSVDGTRLVNLQAEVFDADGRKYGSWLSTATNLQREGDLARLEYCSKHHFIKDPSVIALGNGVVGFDLRLKPPKSGRGFIAEILYTTKDATGRTGSVNLRRFDDKEVELFRNSWSSELSSFLRTKLVVW